MSLTKYVLSRNDTQMLKLIKCTNHKILAIWAIDCANRVISFYEDIYPQDNRPQRALLVLQEWINTGVFSMSVIRKAALDSHAAARSTPLDSPARSVARACGQAVATAHVPRHAYGSAIYSQQAIFLNSDMTEAVKERNWQYQRLLNLNQI